jgi:putative oxidoreductase
MLWPSLLEYSDLGMFAVRFVLAAVFIYHAYPKLKDSKGMAKMMGAPSMMVLAMGLMELFAGLSVLLGVYIQLGALMIAVIMVGAIKMKVLKWKTPFSATDKMGWEFDLVLLAMALLLLTSGGGEILMLK